jgi:hypothetical protein
MKRCPQCEFLYEDDQSLCDMDGKELIHDSIPLSSHLTSAFPSTHLQSVTAENALAEGAAVGVARSLAAGARPAVELIPLHVSESTVVETAVSEATSPLVVSEAVMEKARPEWRRFALMAAVGVLLGMLAFLVYYVSLRHRNAKFETQNTTSDPQRQSAAQNDNGSPEPNTNGSLTQPVVAAQPLNEDAEPSMTTAATKTDAIDERFPITKGVPPLPRVRPLPRLPAAKVEETGSTSTESSPKPVSESQKTTNANPKTTAVNQQKDSKVGSFLKKTGRLLKKPFKF